MKNLKQFIEAAEYVKRGETSPHVKAFNIEELDYTDYKATGLHVWDYSTMIIEMKSERDDSLHYEVALDDTIYTYFNLNDAAELIWDEVYKTDVLSLSNSDLYLDLTERIINALNEPLQRDLALSMAIAYEPKRINDDIDSEMLYLKNQANKLTESILN